MTKRFVTAREQYELLSPWRTDMPESRSDRTAAVHNQLMQIVAMADTTPWHPFIESNEESKSQHGRGKDKSYFIGNPDPGRITDQPIAQLDVTLHNKGDKHWRNSEPGRPSGFFSREHNEAYINSIIVHPDFQGQGVAQALIERLNGDHPEYKINPGVTTPKGYGLVQQLKKLIPDSEEKISPDYKPYVMDDGESAEYEKSEYENVGHEDYEYDDYTREYSPKNRQLVKASYDDGPYWGAAWDDEDDDDEDDWPEGTVPKGRKHGNDLANAPIYMGVDEDSYVGKHRKEKEPGKVKKWLKSWHPDEIALSLASEKRVASQQFLAMAWEEWAPQIKTLGPSKEGTRVGIYYIPHTENQKEDSQVAFTVHPDDRISIAGIQTNYNFRNQGVAEALMRRINQDFPNHKIEPGKMTVNGRGFHDRMLEKEPAAKDVVAARFWRTSMVRHATAPVLDKPADFPDDWFEKHWGDDDDAPLPVPEQTGPPPRPADKILNEWVEARDSITPENLSDWHAAPWTNPLEQTLYKEFQHDWWPNSEASKVRTPENVNTGWSFHPDEPITHWLNVEDFLNERYPEAATGGKYGLEHAAPMLQRKVNDQMLSPEKMKEYGYVGHGNAITQAMLNLHNKLQGRKWDRPQDQKRYYELMLKHIGPNGKKVSRLAKLIEAMAWQEWAPQIKHYPNFYGGLAPDYHLYQIDHGPEEDKDSEMLGLDRNSSLSFQVMHNDKEVQIESIDTHPSFRNQGIAEAMMRKLHQEHPGHTIVPGPMSQAGRAFYDRMLEKEPTARELVAAAHEVMRHANYLESPEGRAHLEQLMQMQQQQEKFRNGPHENWYHVSPHDLPEGTKLVPGGVGDSATSQDFYDMGFGDDSGNLKDMGAGRTQHVWLTPDLDDAHFWSAALNAPHIYQVDPHKTPSPWNGTGTDGFVSPGATIRKKVSGGQ